MKAPLAHNDARDSEAQPWADVLYRMVKESDIRQACYVPNSGHARAIRLLRDDRDIATTALTTEEEGVALITGAWLGGQRSVLLMQSSGVGNCTNMLSLVGVCRVPMLAVITMRGEWAEFNPWQVPMGRATQATLELMGVTTVRIDQMEEAEDTLASAATLAFDSNQAVAVLLSQRLLGAKKWMRK